MKCKEISERMPELAAGFEPVTPELEQHLQSCSACTAQLQEFRQTMALLDEWQAPEPSPYFSTRVMARVREEQARPSGWLAWLRRPALAVSLAVLMVMSATLIRTDYGAKGVHSTADVANIVEPGTAVGDLQALDKNSELYSDFDVLDDLAVQQDVVANP
jgi:predicted anti-sigma-YlaC factor YlaD